jgi:peptidoglycan/LPS O-acetylase OafA/YrhL
MRISFLFPLLIVPIVRGRRLGAEALLLSLYTVSVLLPPSPSWLAPVSETLFLAIYFVLGALLAQNAERVRAALARWPAMGRAVFLGAGLVLTWGPSQHFHNIVSALGACIVIAAALSPGRIERFLMLPSLRWLGKISYSLYLVHVPVLLTVYYLARDRVPLPIIALAAVPLALLAAAAFHRLIEAPAMRLGHTLTRAKFPRLGEVGSAD